MRRRRAYLPWLGFVIGIGLLLSGCARRSVKTVMPAPEQKQPGSSFKFEGYSFVFPPDRQPRIWEVKAKTGTGSTDTSTLTLAQVECTLYRDGKPSLRVSAQSGKAEMRNKVAHLSLSGDVRAVELTKQRTLQAEEFEWSAATNRITASKLRWQGEGLEASADTGTFATDLSEGVFTGHVVTKSAGK